MEKPFAPSHTNKLGWAKCICHSREEFFMPGTPVSMIYGNR